MDSIPVESGSASLLTRSATIWWSQIHIQPTTAIAEKTVRLFLSSKAVVSSKPVNKPSSISSKTVVFSDNLSSIVVVSAIVVSAIAVVCCTCPIKLIVSDHTCYDGGRSGPSVDSTWSSRHRHLSNYFFNIFIPDSLGLETTLTTYGSVLLRQTLNSKQL